MAIQGGEIVPRWLLPTLSEVVTLSDPTRMVGEPVQTGFRQDCAAPSALNDSTPRENGHHRRTSTRLAPSQLRADREWTGAIAALDELLHQFLTHSNSLAPTIDLNNTPTQAGFILSGPSPVLSHTEVVKSLSTWTVATTSAHAPHWLGFQLLPADKGMTASDLTNPILPLLPGDPVADEQFCLLLTPWFSLVLVLGESLTGEPAFMFSFAPDVVQRAWEALRPRILLMSSHQVDFLDELVMQFPPVIPDFKTVMQFSRLMLEHLPEPLEDNRAIAETETNSKASTVGGDHVSYGELFEPSENGMKAKMLQAGKARSAKIGYPVEDTETDAYTALPDPSSFDVELVKAIAHEVRTPLTTIRTLTRSLLKRSDLPADVLRRLSIIDRECSEQIDRFGLIFKAVEIESATQSHMALIRTSLTDVFQQSIPRWQQQATQRQMTLKVDVPQEMPTVVSDPTVLDQALTSLIERFTRNLPAGSHIQLEVTLAGSQLKVQLQSQPDEADSGLSKEHPFSSWKNSAKSIGQMLMFQPETGSLSLNLAVTKNLFQAIGGKLIVKQRPQQGEVMTVYLPLEVGSVSPLDGNKIITV
ncbi:MAG: HAMP domain-containing histidine kinase [Oscillatoriales cyanobacterium C42_A2020_001]|nr:HAMP domain-containing histidine kinase [Leptolyngbyaceae cyanobacterium C42_A2020_001]